MTLNIDTDTDSHDCGLCGKTYRSRGAALRCCTDRFDDSDDSDPDPNADAVAREDGGRTLVADGGSEPMERIADALELQNAILQQLVLETHRGYQHHRDEGRSPKSVSTSVIDRHGELYGFQFGDDTPVSEEVLGR